EDGIRDRNVTGVQTCALPISGRSGARRDGIPTVGWATTITRSPSPLVVAHQKSNATSSANACWDYLDEQSREYFVNLLPDAEQQIGRASCRERGGVYEGRVRV